MKKILAVLVLIFLLLPGIFANSQKIYRVDSSIYRKITKLYVLSGHALPSTTGPWSGDELEKMLKKLDRDEIPSYLLPLYEEAEAELSSEPSLVFNGGAMEWDGTLNGDIYAHTYSGDISRKDVGGIEETAFAGRNFWFGADLTKNNPFFEVDWQTWMGDNFYTYFNIYLSNSIRGKDEIGSTKLNSNIPAFQNFKLDVKLLDVNFPSRAFLSAGGSGWSLEIGRDRLSWGSGKTGNLVLSDNFPYHDMVRATAYSDIFKYTYLISFFPCKMNYYGVDSSGSRTMYNATNNNNSSRYLQGVALYTAHRLEARLFSDSLSFTLTEAVTLDSQDGSIPFVILSPTYFMHNGYMHDNTNSTLAFEVNWTPVSGLALYAQLLLDNFAMPLFETAPGPGQSSVSSPDAKAYLLGARYMRKAGEGILTVNPEGAYVMPMTYIRNSGRGYGIDYAAAVKYRLFSYEDYAGSTDILYDEHVLGYTYGPDCIVGSIDVEWEWNRLSVGSNFFFMAHGTHDLWTKYTTIAAGTTEDDYNSHYTGLSTDHSNTGNYRYGDAQSTRNSIWYTYDIGLSASYRILDNLSVSGALDYIMMKNIYNVSGADASDVQLILSVSYTPF